MAIDSEEKRRSALLDDAGAVAVLPVADGSVAQGDRQHVVGIYSGILAGGGGGTTVPVMAHYYRTQRRR